MIETKMKRHCTIQSEEINIKCKRKHFTSIKVQVRHSDTGRITWQTWHLCQFHFGLFLNEKGEGWYTWYIKKPFKKAFVIDFKIVGAI